MKKKTKTTRACHPGHTSYIKKKHIMMTSIAFIVVVSKCVTHKKTTTFVILVLELATHK
jgi:hypothetical protein